MNKGVEWKTYFRKMVKDVTTSTGMTVPINNAEVKGEKMMKSENILDQEAIESWLLWPKSA